MRCAYCDAELTVDEETWAREEPMPKCSRCRRDPDRIIDNIRRKGGFGATFEERSQDDQET